MASRPTPKISAEGAGPPRQSWLDAQGRELRSESTLPFGTMVATEVRAAPQLGRGELTADVFTRTIVRSNVRLPAPRALDKLVVDLSLDDPEGKLAPIDGGDRRDRARARAAGRRGRDLGGRAQFLAANATIDPGDPHVQQIARDATAGAMDPWDQAQRLQRWVTTHMTFDAGIAFAPAAALAPAAGAVRVALAHREGGRSALRRLLLVVGVGRGAAGLISNVPRARW